MLSSLIFLLIAVIVALIIWKIVSLFIADSRINQVIGLLLGLVVLIYGLKLFLPYVR